MGKIVVRPYIVADDMFDVPLKTFCDYAGRKEVNFSIGDGGIYLKLKNTLENEACEIDVTESGVYVYASTQKGMHNALAILLSNIDVENGEILLDLSCKGENPDMPYRGLMVDLARQKHPVSYIYEYIDVCYINRATHLQLHFSDNESFTLPISAFPKLSTEGRTYTREEISGICDYAKSRGIILVPEVDVPGHTIQFCEKYPELFGTTKILPADEKVYDAVKTIFSEVVDMFPDSPLIHIGGDEVDVDNWENCNLTQEYMKRNGIESY